MTVQEFYGVPVAWDADSELQEWPGIRVTESPSPLFDDSAVYHRWEEKEGNSWLVASRLRDGSFCLRFDDAEFQIVMDGSRVKFYLLPHHPATSPRHYFINTVLPLILNLRGTEVLHASSVLVRDSAGAFFGNGGFGKSTFAAAMVQAGHRLLSDDAVVLLPRGTEVLTTAGIAEMNLHPHARRFLRPDSREPGKAKIHLNEQEHATGSYPLRWLFFIEPRQSEPGFRLEELSGGDLVVALVRAAHRLDIEDRQMLARQLETLEHVASAVSARRIYYPAGFDNPTVMARIVIDAIALPETQTAAPIAEGTP